MADCRAVFKHWGQFLVTDTVDWAMVKVHVVLHLYHLPIELASNMVC